MSLAVILSFIVELHAGYSEIQARTLALTMFVMLSFFQVFCSRAENKSLFYLRLLANKPLLLTSLAALGLPRGSLTIGRSWMGAGVCWPAISHCSTTQEEPPKS